MNTQTQVLIEFLALKRYNPNKGGHPDFVPKFFTINVPAALFERADAAVAVPVGEGSQVTADMLRTAQLKSELGAYACANLAGGYHLITELFNVMSAAAPQAPAPAPAQADRATAVPLGWKLVAVNEGFDDLMYWLGRCDDKGHLENCADLIEPWAAFDYRAVDLLAAQGQQKVEVAPPEQPTAALPVAPESEALCPACAGSGTIRAMTSHLGPDDYEYDEQCAACNGSGSPDLKDALASVGGIYSPHRPNKFYIDQSEVMRIVEAHAAAHRREA